MELNGTFFATLVAFLLLYGALYKVLYQPVSKVMQERSERIRSAIEEAENARAEAERLLEEYKSQISSARQEAQKILDQAKTLGDQTREEIVAKAKAEATRAIEKASLEIERNKNQALDELQGKVADLAVGAASVIIGKSLDKSDHTGLIEDYLAQAGKASNN